MRPRHRAVGSACQAGVGSETIIDGGLGVYKVLLGAGEASLNAESPLGVFRDSYTLAGDP